MEGASRSNVGDKTVVCAFVSDFELAVLAGGRQRLLAEPLAVAPTDPGREGVGEVSPPARARGVTPGTKLSEALARCPDLRLVDPDPELVAARWEQQLDALEQLGAEPESDQPGLAFFLADGLIALHGGQLAGLLARTRAALGAVRLGVAPARFCAHVAALVAPARRDLGQRLRIVEEMLGARSLLNDPDRSPLPASLVVQRAEAAAFLARQPVRTLSLRPELATLATVLGELGVATLGELAALPRAAVAERFGPEGMLAHELALGRDTPLCPRRPRRQLSVAIDLPDPGCGLQLERAATVLVERLLARRERLGRSVRVVVLTAVLEQGGSWRVRIVPRRPTADPALLASIVARRLSDLPAPATQLRLVVEEFGPPAVEQLPLAGLDTPSQRRRERLREAVRQVHSALGANALLRVLEVDPEARVPERRALLVPFAER